MFRIVLRKGSNLKIGIVDYLTEAEANLHAESLRASMLANGKKAQAKSVRVMPWDKIAN